MGRADGDEAKRAPEERHILDEMEKRRGAEYVEANEELILAQARLVGDL